MPIDVRNDNALDGPSIRITTPHISLPAADSLEGLELPPVERIEETIAKSKDGEGAR